MRIGLIARAHSVVPRRRPGSRFGRWTGPRPSPGNDKSDMAAGLSKPLLRRAEADVRVAALVKGELPAVLRQEDRGAVAVGGDRVAVGGDEGLEIGLVVRGDPAGGVPGRRLE